MTISQSLADILARIEAARKAAIKPAPSTRLVAVSKTVPAEGIREALAAGQRLFGENRVQEAQAKFPALKSEFPDLELHLIGPLQTNKVKDAMALFDVIQTLDRVKLADAFAVERERSGRCPRLFLQVNTGEEPQKAGVLPRDTAALIAYARKLELPLDGTRERPHAGRRRRGHDGDGADAGRGVPGGPHRGQGPAGSVRRADADRLRRGEEDGVFLEHRGGGIDVLSVADWTSPVSIRFKVAPLRAGSQALRLKRTISVLSAHSFSVADELSENGGPFQRLGSAVFSQAAAESPAAPPRD